MEQEATLRLLSVFGLESLVERVALKQYQESLEEVGGRNGRVGRGGWEEVGGTNGGGRGGGWDERRGGRRWVG